MTVSVHVVARRSTESPTTSAATFSTCTSAPPGSAVAFDSSDEGHALRYDAVGRLVGLTIVNARWLLARDGEIVVSPPALRVGAAEIGPILAGTS